MNGQNDTSRLEGYLHADTKYNVVPVPTPVARATALDFVTRELARPKQGGELAALARLAIFYDLHETAEGFLALTKPGLPEEGDVPRMAAALTAVAWLGDDAAFAEAAARFSKLALRADLDLHRATLLDAADAFGPRLGSAPLRAAVSAAIARIQAEQNALKPEEANPRRLDVFENRRARLEEFDRFELGHLDRANTLREAISALPEAERLKRLAALYLRDAPDATERLAGWAALKLIRLPEPARSAAEFVRLAAIDDKNEVRRARALRAAEFFGQRLPVPQEVWLASHADGGTDPLALRPHWKYPSPHSHGH